MRKYLHKFTYVGLTEATHLNVQNGYLKKTFLAKGEQYGKIVKLFRTTQRYVRR